MHSIRIIGPGRAGTSLAAALSARGWAFAGFLGRHDELAARRRAASTCWCIATPDDAVAEVAAAVAPVRAPRWPTSRVRSGSTRWRRTRCGRPCTRWCRCPTARSVPPACVLGVTFAVAGAPLARDMVARASGAGWSRSPTTTGRPTTPPPASRPTTWWRCWARSSGWPPRSGSTSSPSSPDPGRRRRRGGPGRRPPP